MSYYKQSVGSTKCLPSFQATVHTTSVKRRGINLRGLAAYVIQVGEGGDPAFRIPEELLKPYHYGGSALTVSANEQDMEAHFDKLFEKYEITWLRALHNPNVAFMDSADIRSGYHPPIRLIVAKYFIATLKKKGYHTVAGITK